MKRVIAAAALIVVGLAAPAPRTPGGTPDLSGVWRMDPGGHFDNIASDLKPGEVLPWADALFKRRSEEFATGHPIYRCMPEIGPLQSFGVFKILQTPGTMGFLAEAGTYRNILTDGRELPADPNPTWAGYSVGRWDGDTFVVSSAGFNDQTWLDYNGHRTPRRCTSPSGSGGRPSARWNCS